MEGLVWACGAYLSYMEALGGLDGGLNLSACSYTCHKASLGFSIKNKNRWVKALLNCLFVCMLFQVVAGFQMQPVFVFVGNPFWVPSHR